MAESKSSADVWSLLDRAITEVAWADYSRLTSDMSLSAQGEFVDRALKDLLELKQGKPPDYNSEGVALFYLTWFQPRQIFLAYSALRHVISKQKPPSQIIDYGCGASTVQIALSILIAENAEEPEIFAVHGIDPSDPMRRIGGVLWQKIKGGSRQDYERPRLHRFCSYRK